MDEAQRMSELLGNEAPPKQEPPKGSLLHEVAAKHGHGVAAFRALGAVKDKDGDTAQRTLVLLFPIRGMLQVVVDVKESGIEAAEDGMAYAEKTVAEFVEQALKGVAPTKNQRRNTRRKLG